MDRDSVARVAKGLTKAQREAIKRCASNGNELTKGGLDDDGVSIIVLDHLRAKGVLFFDAGRYELHTGSSSYRLTPLGLAVRAHLQSQDTSK